MRRTPSGANSARQSMDSSFGMPTSPRLVTAGSAAALFAAVTSRHFTTPLFKNFWIGGIVPTYMSTWRPASATVDSPAPLNGTSCCLMPKARKTRVAASCPSPPGPSVPNEYLFGFFFRTSRNSVPLLAGKSGAVQSTYGALLNCMTGM